MTFLSIIAVVYVLFGTTSVAYFHKEHLGVGGWFVPVLCWRWDKHGALEISIGFVYGAADYLIHVGLLAH